MNNDRGKDSRTSRLIQDFAGYTTLHGFHFVVEHNAAVRRLIWLCLILFCFSFLVVQLVQSYKKLNENQHVIDKNIIHSESLVFPAFTLCNVNMMKRSKINGTTDSQLYLDKLDVLKRNKVKNQTLSRSFDIEKAVLENGHTAKDMVKLCTWKGIDCGPVNFTTFFSNVYGLCHTFNLGTNGTQLLSSKSSQRDLGLVLLIDIENEEYYGPFSFLSTGMKVLVHDQSEYPIMDEYGNDVMPGFTTTIKIKRKWIERLPPPYPSGCGSRKLEVSNVYSQSKCMMECYTRDTINQFGCRLLGMPNLPASNSTRYCSGKDLSNDSLIAEALTKPLVKDCDCPPPCKEVAYKTSYSLSYFPSSTFFDSFPNVARDNLLVSKNILRSRFLLVNAHFEDLNTDVTIEKPRYNLSDFGSDVGGNLGLFMGCSVLTVVEFIDLLIMYCRERNRVRGSNPSNDNSIET